MAAITWADVSAFASELATVAAAAQADILAHVNTAFTVDLLGGEDAPRLRLARIYLAAHVATLSRQGGVTIAGPVISERADNISRSYAQVAIGMPSSEWSSTPYGQLLANLVRTSSARFPRVF